MRTNRKPLSVRAMIAGAALVPAAVAGPALAAAPPEQVAGRAAGKALSASLFGRPVEFGTSLAHSEWRDGQPAVAAEGVGLSALAEQTRSVAQLGSPGAGGRHCATPPPGLLAVAGAGPALPALDVSAACGEASAAGDSGAFQAAASGGGTSLGIAAPAVLGQAVSTLRSTVDPGVLPLGLGSLLVPGSGDAARSAVQSLDGLLGGLLPGVGVGSLLPTLTVGGLLDQLGKGELARITLEPSVSRAEQGPAGYLARAVAHGGTIDLLPGLLGRGGAPLARISVSDSDASVRIEPAADHTLARVTDPEVRIESPVLEQLALKGLAGTGVTGLLRPGQRLSLLCEGGLSPLCTEIAVKPAQGPTTTAEGRTAVSAATVSVRMLQVPALGGVELVVGAAQAEAGRSVPVEDAAAGPGTGARITAAGFDAGASAAAVPSGQEPPGATASRAAATLPRTGGLPFHPWLAPLALLGSVGLPAARRLRLRRA